MSDKNWVVIDPIPRETSIKSFSTQEEAIEYANTVIEHWQRAYDNWGEDIKGVVIAKVTHRCQRNNRIERPPDSELDKTGCDSSGQYWGDHEYLCEYEMQEVEGE